VVLEPLNFNFKILLIIILKKNTAMESNNNLHFNIQGGGISDNPEINQLNKDVEAKLQI
jgi:hypothetical protein